MHARERGGGKGAKEIFCLPRSLAHDAKARRGQGSKLGLPVKAVATLPSGARPKRGQWERWVPPSLLYLAGSQRRAAGPQVHQTQEDADASHEATLTKTVIVLLGPCPLLTRHLNVITLSPCFLCSHSAVGQTAHELSFCFTSKETVELSTVCEGGHGSYVYSSQGARKQDSTLTSSFFF